MSCQFVTPLIEAEEYPNLRFVHTLYSNMNDREILENLMAHKLLLSYLIILQSGKSDNTHCLGICGTLVGVSADRVEQICL